MQEEKVKLSFEKQIAMSLLIAVVGVLLIGTMLTPIFNTPLAIEINNAFIAFLPDSFDPLRFASGDPDILQKGEANF